MISSRKRSLFHCGTFHLIVYIIVISQDDATCLRLSELRIPNHILQGNSAKLECLYELDPGESLYSVKWYKDGNEFYRYHPKDKPPVTVHKHPGLSVDLMKSTDTSVTLEKVSLAASGKYRCEVLGEAPSFHTLVDHGHMTVVVVPEHGPQISGGRDRYHEGDTVKVTCTCGPCSPPADLAWFINGATADPSFLRGPKRKVDSRGLNITTLGLEFKVSPEHLKRGNIKIKCLATIATMYLRSSEVSAEGERPHRAPALESRDSSTARADKVRANTVKSSGNQLNKPVTCVVVLSLIVQKLITDR